VLIRNPQVLKGKVVEDPMAVLALYSSVISLLHVFRDHIKMLAILLLGQVSWDCVG
jgi:hypothetical protein